MQPLTSDGQEQLRSIAQRYGVSVDAAQTLLEALMRGSGTMAQFSHPELGGSGQWMRGGMTMVGDMFNNGLRATVDGLCNELSRLLESAPFQPLSVAQQQFQGGSVQMQGSGGFGWSPLPSWWPGELGQPNASGGQNDLRYAYFAGPRRLAIEQNGVVSVYDTLDHQIGGVSQQQGSGYSLSFSSQYGTVDLRQLPLVSTNAPAPPPPAYAQESYGAPSPAAPSFPPPPPSAVATSEQDVFATIERLAGLKQKGLITEEEFANKKSELLARL
ncbi:MAG: SHOCT domain-containing protein [Polyangiales bacterium]